MCVKARVSRPLLSDCPGIAAQAGLVGPALPRLLQSLLRCLLVFRARHHPRCHFRILTHPCRHLVAFEVFVCLHLCGL